MTEGKSKINPALIAGAAIAIGATINIVPQGLLGFHDLAMWIVTLLCTIVLTACIGKAINDNWSGVLISSSNRISLSKLQMTTWTLLILSSLISMAAHNFHFHYADNALNIVINPHLLIVMGISTTSLIASPAVLSLRTSQDGDGNTATLTTRSKPSEASWLDIFRGDTSDISEAPDLSKIQQFLVTLVVVATYAIILGKQFQGLGTCKGTGDACRFSSFPELSEQVVWLIGISHAGYIAYKAVPKPGASSSDGTRTAGTVDDDGALG